MKKLYSFVFGVLVCCTFVVAQSPQAIPFQAIIRDSSGNLLVNHALSVRVGILVGSSTASPTYQEIQSVTTNNLGLLNLSIGQGTPQIGTFAAITWGSGPIYVEIDVDLSGGSNFSLLGVTQLQSVPYALYSLNGGGSQPNGQVAYGTGSGLSSDSNFTRDPGSNKTIISDNIGTGGTTQLRLDSSKVFMEYYDYATNSYAGHFAGSAFPDWNLNSICIADIVFDQNNNIKYGYYADADSSQMVTDATQGGAIVGTNAYSAYMDVAIGVAADPAFNSLTVDTSGLHWEYADTDRYTFPNYDGQAGQVLSTNGAGILSWSAGSGGGSAQPTGQIPYGNGTGTGLTSDPGFVRDSATGEVDLMISPSGQSATYVKEDSDGVLMLHQNSTGNKMAFVGLGNPSNMLPGLGPLMVVAGIADMDSNLVYGLHAQADSTELITMQFGNQGVTGNYGLAGCSQYSSYLDMAYNGGSSLNSLTVDSTGAHWEYNDTDQYTFPPYDGSIGQVLSTNGNGTLSWQTAGGGSAQPRGQITYGSGTGITSDGNFTRDSATGEVDLTVWPSLINGTHIKIDSDGFLILQANSSQNKIAMFGVGNPSHLIPGLGPLMVVAGVIDGDSNLIYGLHCEADSTELVTQQLDENGNPANYGLAGCSMYSSYLDMAYSGGNVLNSFTVDSTGAHWEYNNTDQYTLPITDGTTGQIMTTNGAGVLSFTSLPITTTAWNSHQIITGSGNASDTVSLQNNKNNIYNSTTAVSSLLVNLPGSPNDGDIFILTLNASVSSITFQNGAVATAASNVAASSKQKTYTYDGATSTWN